MNLESAYMSLNKNDLVKSLGPAIFGAILPLVVPAYNSMTAALLAGTLPALPSLLAVSTLLLKCLGIGVTTATSYLIHKFFSGPDGTPFNGALDKYLQARPPAPAASAPEEERIS